MRSVNFHQEADAEVTEAAQYYETTSAGLGFSFLMELERCIDQVVANPKAANSSVKRYGEYLSGVFPTACSTSSLPIEFKLLLWLIKNGDRITGGLDY